MGLVCYLHLVDFYMVNVGKYTSPMDPMGYSSKARFYVRSAWHSMTNGMGNGNLGVDESYNLVVAPSQDASHHQDYYMFNRESL